MERLHPKRGRSRLRHLLHRVYRPPSACIVLRGRQTKRLTCRRESCGVRDSCRLCRPVRASRDDRGSAQGVFPGGVHDGAGPNQFKAHLGRRLLRLSHRRLSAASSRRASPASSDRSGGSVQRTNRAGYIPDLTLRPPLYLSKFTE